MEIRRVIYSSRFLRSLRRLGPAYVVLVQEREVIFRKECFDPRLETHKLKGKWRGYWAFSITHSYRVMFEFVDHETVGFVNVGDHTIYR